MAQTNFDKAIAHFSTANIVAKNANDEALANIAAGLQRLSEALHNDTEQILKALREYERERAG